MNRCYATMVCIILFFIDTRSVFAAADLQRQYNASLEVLKRNVLKQCSKLMYKLNRIRLYVWFRLYRWYQRKFCQTQFDDRSLLVDMEKYVDLINQCKVSFEILHQTIVDERKRLAKHYSWDDVKKAQESKFVGNVKLFFDFLIDSIQDRLNFDPYHFEEQIVLFTWSHWSRVNEYSIKFDDPAIYTLQCKLSQPYLAFESFRQCVWFVQKVKVPREEVGSFVKQNAHVNKFNELSNKFNLFLEIFEKADSCQNLEMYVNQFDWVSHSHKIQDNAQYWLPETTLPLINT